MPESIEANKKLWESLKQEDEIAKAIHLAADLGELATRQSILDRAEIRKQLVEIRREAHEELKELRIHIMGNGDPSKGIKARLEVIEKCLLEDKQRKEKVWWIIIPIVITQIVTIILNLIGG